MLAVSTTTTMEELRMEAEKFEMKEERKEIEEKEEEEEEEEEEETEAAPCAVWALEKTSNLQIEKFECGQSTMFGFERLMMEMVLLFSLLLNLYLVLVYPILMFMGRNWLKRQMDRQREPKEDQIFPGMRLDIEKDTETDKFKEKEKENARVQSWFKLFGKAKWGRKEKY